MRRVYRYIYRIIVTGSLLLCVVATAIWVRTIRTQAKINFIW